MQQLIDVIRAAIATDANSEEKAAGVQACRTIATALDTEPGKPLTMPGSATTQPTSRVSIDQLLDLLIARLNMVATDRERTHALTKQTASEPPAPRGLQIPFVPSNALKRAPNSADARSVPQKNAPHSARAPRSLPTRRA